MTAPAEAAAQLLAALAWGLALGVAYSFLRPLRQRAPHLADGLFVPCMVAGWVYVSFGICRGDIRMGYTAAMLAGIAVWEATAGWLLRGCFRWLWQGIFAVLGFPRKILGKLFGKIRKISKNLFASAKKWSTIKCNDRRKRRSTGGSRYGKDHRYAQPCEAGIQAHQ